VLLLGGVARCARVSLVLYLILLVALVGNRVVYISSWEWKRLTGFVMVPGGG